MGQYRTRGSYSIVPRGKRYRGKAPTGVINPETDKQIIAYKSGKTKSEVTAKLDAAIEQYQAGIDPKAGEQTVAQFIAKWLAGKNDIAERTQTRYGQDLTHAINYPISKVATLGGVPLKNITVTHILALKNMEGLSKSQRHSTFARFKTVIESAVRERIILSNPYATLDPRKDFPKPVTRDGDRTYPKKAYELWQVQQILSAAEGSDIEMLIKFIYETGCRINEALALKWVSINEKNCQVTFSENRDTSNGRRDTSDTKNGKTRTLFITPELLSELKEHRKNMLFIQFGADALVFPDVDGGFLLEWNVGKKYKAILEELGLYTEGTLWHGLRHTNATLMIGNGVNVKTVQERLGHATAAFTLDNYVKPLAAEDKAAAQLIGSLTATSDKETSVAG